MMLGALPDRLPNFLRKILRPTWLKDNFKLDHNWGNAFLFQNVSVMRVYAWSQPPHILPKNIQLRFEIMEFLWYLIMMDMEYLGPKLHKGTFLCRFFKIGDLTIGKESVDKIHEC